MKNMRHFCLLHTKNSGSLTHFCVKWLDTTGVTCSVAYFGSYLESLCTKIFEKLTLSRKQMVTTGFSINSIPNFTNWNMEQNNVCNVRFSNGHKKWSTFWLRKHVLITSPVIGGYVHQMIYLLITYNWLFYSLSYVQFNCSTC